MSDHLKAKNMDALKARLAFMIIETKALDSKINSNPEALGDDLEACYYIN